MRTSQYLLSTLKETPADAEVISHQLMLRAGMIRKLASGLYTWLPTGVRVRMAEGWFLAIMPKSGLGFKYRLQMDNTVGIIDSDYYYSDNEGHIFVKITNDGNHGKIITLSPGAAVCQGLFLPFGITESDAATARRNGGFGSTAK